MKLTYEDLISGDLIPVNNLGHLRPPQLREIIKPTEGIGTQTYYLYINVLAWDKASILKFFKSALGSNVAKLEDDRLSVFDVITLIEFSRELIKESLSFFLLEDIAWDEKARHFSVISREGQVVGYIDRENFEEVRDLMLQLNYIGVGKDAKPLKHSSRQAEELWERAQQYLKEESSKTHSDKTMSLGNIISKVCAVSTSYSLLNIFDLTIFQLYDQFFQCGYIRAMDLNDAVFSNHGGKDFDVQAWLKPLTSL